MEKQTQVFMLQEGNNGTSRLASDYYYSVDDSVAKQLEADGKAIVTDDITNYGKYDNDIRNEVVAFKKAYDKMKDSADPRYQDAKFFEQEVAKLRAELDENVGAMKEEYAATVRATKLAAERERANMTKTITPEDSRGAQQLMSELVGQAKLNGIESAIERIQSDLPYYTDGRRAALATELYRLVDLVGDKDRDNKSKLRSLYNALEEDSQGIVLGARMAKALSEDVGTAYDTMRKIHRAYKR